jgi:hypothetical protein
VLSDGIRTNLYFGQPGNRLSVQCHQRCGSHTLQSVSPQETITHGSRLEFWFSDTWFSLLWFAKRLKPVPVFAGENPFLERFFGVFAEFWYFSQNKSGGFRSLRKMVAFIP